MQDATQLNVTLVGAGAGSGKTNRLGEILHAELTSGRARPGGVIVTTFTVRAAAELRERVRAHLLARGDFGRAAAIGEARIGTVNGVCHQLLERFAFEAGLSPEQRVLDEPQSKAMLSRALDGVVDGPELAALVSVAWRLGLDEGWRADLEALVRECRANNIDGASLGEFARRNAEDLLAHFPRPAGDDLDALLTAAIERVLPEVEAAARTGGKKVTEAYLAQLRVVLDGLRQGTAPWSSWAKLAGMAPEKGLQPAVADVALLAGRAGEHPRLHADVACYLGQLFDLCARTLQGYAESKRQLGALDFTDQEHLLLGLLDEPEVAAVLREELDLVLVDEFQDTSPMQLALFLELARLARASFWVGDVKQSIYGFRGSDAELMQAVVGALPLLGGSHERLDTSYRSRPQLVRLVNAIFARAFAGTLEREEIELLPSREDALPGPALANWLLGGKNAGEETQALARGIRRLAASGYAVLDKGASEARAVRYGDIAVLCRTNDDVQRVAAELRAQGIPCATAQPGLLETPEAVLALACLRRLIDGGDTIATAEILSLAECIEPEDWIADRLRYLAEEGVHQGEWRERDGDGRSATPLLARLRALRECLPLMTPREAMEAAVLECELAERVMRWSRHPDVARVRLANLDALVELAGNYEEICAAERNAASSAGLLRWLWELQAAGQDMLAQPAVDAVKVLTHHGAKGLEWNVVVLTGLGSQTRDRLWSISAQSDGALDVAAPLRGRFIRCWPWPFGMQRKVAVGTAIAGSAVAQRFRDAATEEDKRLLYVSMTRARDLLVLARSARGPDEGWIATVEAPWLLPQAGEGVIALPGGATLQAERWELEPTVAGWPVLPDDELPPLRWFPVPEAPPARMPLVVSPSAAGAQPGTRVLATVRVGDRIAVPADADMRAVGSAIHAVLAVGLTDPAVRLDPRDVSRITEGFDVADSLSELALLRQAQELRDWIAVSWPGADIAVECPVQAVLANGQVLQGRVDLLLDTAAGWVLIDHKSTPASNSGRFDQLAVGYGGQLARYADAIQLATGRPVIETWLYLPVAATALRVAVG